MSAQQPTASVILDAMLPSDYPAALRLWSRFLPGFDAGFDTAERIETYLTRNPGLSSVAKHESDVVGALLCGTDGRRGSLYHMVVHPDWRRRGVARGLVERSLEMLRREGIVTGFCFTGVDNIPAHAFWSAMGFVHAEGVQYRSRSFARSVVGGALQR